MAYTVKDLLEACEEQVAKGNGNKEIFISQDDEGNSYHRLFYLFTPLTKKSAKEFNDWQGYGDELDPDKHIILG